MTDLGMIRTEQRYARLAQSIRATYAEASRDMEKKLARFVAAHESKDQKMRGKLAAGKITPSQYASWQRGQVFIGKQWLSKVYQLNTSLSNASATAANLIRTGQFDIFADNANYLHFRIDKDFGMTMNFGLYSAEAVSMLIDQQPELMPRRTIDGVKQEAWNTKIISNCVTQGIIQGESIPDIAKRIARDTALSDLKTATRYARTSCTAAQNAGRIQSMHDAQGMGIRVMKEWITVGDDRVRPGHDELDGETVEVDEPFENEYGLIMYPGDPSASDENVWNCRCALGYYYPDHDKYGPPDYTESEEDEFESWLEE